MFIRFRPLCAHLNKKILATARVLLKLSICVNFYLSIYYYFQPVKIWKFSYKPELPFKIYIRVFFLPLKNRFLLGSSCTFFWGCVLVLEDSSQKFRSKKWWEQQAHREKPRWRRSTRYGTANFFPMGDKVEFFFSSIGFLDTGNPLKPFKMLCARYFSVFKHFPSIYHCFEHRTNIFATNLSFGLQGIKW